MMTYTNREHSYRVEYQPEDEAPWMLSESFRLDDNANGYLSRQRERRPEVKWRLLHRVTVTTVTEEVVE
jgi:hypothetical protein